MGDGSTSSARFPPTAESATAADPDTCRICRGEGTGEEPLFFPCKCSGSIKYVHQDCLMEWLSHSQKKHCELCKTPFRFTKLYAPDMPTALPIHIFISHLAKFLLRNLLVWLRVALVASVWLGWLPYVMRAVWSFLFWISDEGLVGGGSLFGRQNGVAAEGSNVGVLAEMGTTVCPSSPLFAATTTVATIGGVIDQLPLDSVPQLVKNLYGMNLTLADPLASTIIRLLFGSATLTEKLSLANSTLAVRNAIASSSPSHASLLSEVGFLRNLTRVPAINQAVIAMLEGQIITVLVIVCFILIILVRDYVVQQQPEINMRAAFAAPNPPPPPQEEVEVDLEEVEELGGPHVSDDEDGDAENEPLVVDGEDGIRGHLGAAHRDSSSRASRSQTAEGDTLDSGLGLNSGLGPTPSSQPNQLHVPNPNGSGIGEADGTALHDYLRLYRLAGGDPEKILALAREQDLEDKLDYWIRLTRAVIDRNRVSDWDGTGAAESSTSASASASASALASADTTTTGARYDATEGKGKQKAEEDDGEDPTVILGNPLRPRANTDGPKANDTLNPLANNSWSFSDLPPPEPSATSTTSTPASVEAPLLQPHSSVESGPVGPEAEFGFPSAPSSTLAEAGSTREEIRLSSPPPAADAQVEPGQPATQPDLPDFDFNTQPRPNDGGRGARRQPANFVDRIADFMWRDVERIDPAELVVVDDDDDDEDDMDDLGDGEDGVFADAVRVGDMGQDAERDREVVEAAVAAGLDPDAIEDAEDFEGIMELLGMRGPIAGLFQNAIFCAFLVSVTILVGIFLPYNVGRVTVWAVANPMRPARILFSLSKFVQDLALIVLGSVSGSISYCVYAVTDSEVASRVANTTLAGSWNMSTNAAERIRDSFMAEIPILASGEVRNFSAISHESLLVVKGHVASSFSALGHVVAFLFSGDYWSRGAEAVSLAANVTGAVWGGLKVVPIVLSHPESWVINLNLPEPSGPVDLELAYWGGMDRFWAILSGYLALSLIAALYLRRDTPFSSGQTGQEWEASIIDGLNQASGVMKVILIIGIEMLAFPLYCGLLLDLALLPLFEDTTIKSRLLFTLNYPLTSIFVHWFVGTGYMFHFALFVSMCRKILRKGVLYFIRDPDDPEFHPVRDVLERNVTTQLRKILFSAFVYGALVIVCLGGVVWGLSFSLPNVLPIHYSSNEPVLEFPIDLLFYNFLMPLAVKFFKPSDGLHAMYTWWLRKCARVLRLTWFLFGERRIDEEGTLALEVDAPGRERPWWRKLLLELDDDKGVVVPKTWKRTFEGGKEPPAASLSEDRMYSLNLRKASLTGTEELMPDGRFVRAPASDQVKIPKGKSVFLEVTEENERKDGKPDQAETDLYSTGQYQFVYIPPFFRLRIFLFIMLIWIFAAVTGVGITIVPLVFGRRMFKLLIPAHIRTNDIYAFSIGIYILGSAAYAVFHARSIFEKARSRVAAGARSISSREGVRRAAHVALRAVKLIYAYFFLLVVFPMLAISLLELYLLIPLHTYMYSGVLSATTPALQQAISGDSSTAAALTAEQLSPSHTVCVIQAWTIGMLYLKLGVRAVTGWYPDTRLAAAVRAVLRRGWLDPDLSVLTRAFVVPGLALWSAAVAGPLAAASLLAARGLPENILARSAWEQQQQQQQQQPRLAEAAALVLVYRFSFPAAALVAAAGAALWGLVSVFRGWGARTRDEAYLIGERLHNLGAAANGPTGGARGAWRAGGARL
ncbi:hypothetical protein QBC33DRAFT_459397 [Phialemonium atrogriseum]|uniref:RING-type E3 ubiquitin transferase n=1 Tax=Phialemonium atrogriseum TaxID=1093897 RepID=A0AAJ0BSJ0_9PEZI|nr:uncharacterized protein QBC33DRAFT_459397 [Phialemonium atrogriseum]KAK1763471.1 hypothetical protein QBC33DRAFT_459397 [Phialemonium atrogriseum]